jgi:hypothetical protein
MKVTTTTAAKRAHRAVRWYPRQWRERYGDEFEVMLQSEITDTPHSPARAANVVWGGLRNRVAYAGLGGDVLTPPQRRSASFSVLAICSTIFFTFGVVSWSKFQLGSYRFDLATWYGSSSEGVINVIMSWSFVCLIAVALLAIVPLWLRGLHQALRTKSRGLMARLCILPLSIDLLAWGFLRFDAAIRNFVDGPNPYRSDLGLSTLVYDAYIQVRSFVGSPSQLFNARPDIAIEMWSGLAEVLAVVLIGVGVATLIGRVDLSPRLLAFERRLTQLSLVLMGLICVTFVAALVAMPAQLEGIYADQRLTQGSVFFMVVALLLSTYAVERARKRAAPLNSELLS